MIKVIYGEKGMGKTKVLVGTANKLSVESPGDVAFIDDSTQLMYDLKHEIRFINVAEFPQFDQSGFLGFLCGIISQDYDIKGIFVDGLNYILKRKADDMAVFFGDLKSVSQKYGVDFYITINGKNGEMPDFLNEFI